MPVETLHRDSSGFKELNETYFTAFNNDITPQTIARPRSAHEVALLVKEAAQNNAAIAIRGAGHTPWKGAANIENGMTIDLRGVRGIKLHADTNSVEIAAGETWGSVYDRLALDGLATTGGRVSRVGVVGLTLGGGLSYFSSRHGFVCDAVISFEVVLASGEILKADRHGNSDLFAALKGGSNNFGVVTQIELPTFPIGDLWGGMTVHSGPSFPSAANALCDFLLFPKTDPDAHILLSLGWSEMMGGELTVLSLYHSTHEPVEPGPSSLSAFTAIEPRLHSTLRKASIIAFTTEQSSFSVDGGRNLYFTSTIQPDTELLLEIQRLFQQYVKPIQQAKNLAYSVVLQPMTADMLARSAAAGPNALGITPDDGPYINVLLNPVWSEATDDAIMVETSLALLTAIDDAAKAKSKWVPYRFMNYSYKSQEVIESYGPESLKYLRAVSKRYDPEGFFQKNVPGSFKLPVQS